MATTNLFEEAAPHVQKTKSKSGDKPQFVVDGLEKYAAICAAFKILETEKKVAKGTLDSFMFEYFTQEGIKRKSKPDNFKGVENETIASMQLRKRSSRSPLTDVEQGILTENEIPFGAETDTVEAFIFNPEHIEWVRKNSLKISQALTKLGAPLGIIQQQVSTTTYVVTDETIESVFKKDKIELVRQLLPIVTTPAVNPAETPLDKAWELIRKMFAKKKEKK